MNHKPTCLYNMCHILIQLEKPLTSGRTWWLNDELKIHTPVEKKCTLTFQNRLKTKYVHFRSNLFPGTRYPGIRGEAACPSQSGSYFSKFFLVKLCKMWKLYVNSDKAAVSDSRYKKDAFDKMQANKFNVADSEQYKKNEELRKHQSDVQYKVRQLLLNEIISQFRLNLKKNEIISLLWRSLWKWSRPSSYKIWR